MKKLIRKIAVLTAAIALTLLINMMALGAQSGSIDCDKSGTINATTGLGSDFFPMSSITTLLLTDQHEITNVSTAGKCAEEIYKKTLLGQKLAVRQTYDITTSTTGAQTRYLTYYQKENGVKQDISGKYAGVLIGTMKGSCTMTVKNRSVQFTYK